MFGAYGNALSSGCLTFLSQAGLDNHIQDKLDLKRQCIAVKNTRNIGKGNMKMNTKLPKINVDPQTYEVFSDGELLTCEPADTLPLAQRYLLL